MSPSSMPNSLENKSMLGVGIPPYWLIYIFFFITINLYLQSKIFIFLPRSLFDWPSTKFKIIVRYIDIKIIRYYGFFVDLTGGV